VGERSAPTFTLTLTTAPSVWAKAYMPQRGLPAIAVRPILVNDFPDNQPPKFHPLSRRLGILAAQ